VAPASVRKWQMGFNLAFKVLTGYNPGVLLTGPNTLRRRLYIMRLTTVPYVGGVGAEEEISAHVLCECVALATLRHT
jgi:hypothetical protein